ncbi:MAG: putative repeat protein (TIGR04052 family) [Myxococcota bacterium]|jgi:uncharacterized repeat protein (TIGR04052 family)
MLLWLVSCTTPTAITVPFIAVEGAHPITCGQRTPEGLTVSDLRLFVHDVALIPASGAPVPLTLTPGPFQTATVAMLDFEDGCDNGTPPTHTTLTGTAPAGDYTGVTFTLGVPYAENHSDPSRATGPLSATSMHWTWLGGYKFLRLDYARDNHRGKTHLGSTGCRGEIGDPQGCARDNRPTASLPWRPGQTLTLDIAGLIGSEDCMAGEDEPGCAGVFRALGLDLRTGQAARPSEIFR